MDTPMMDDAGAQPEAAAPPTDQPPADEGSEMFSDDNAPVQAGRRGADRGKRARAVDHDYLTAGLEEMLIEGQFKDPEIMSMFSPQEAREKLALQADFNGDIPRLWAIAGDGFLDRMPDCPDVLREEIEQHAQERQEIAQELNEQMVEVRELMQLLDGNAAPVPTIAPAAAPMALPFAPLRAMKQAKRVVADIENDVTQPGMPPMPSGTVKTQPGKGPASRPPGTEPAEDDIRQQTQKNTAEQNRQQFQVIRNWWGQLSAVMSALQRVTETLERGGPETKMYKRNNVQTAFSLLHGLITPEVQQYYLQPLHEDFSSPTTAAMQLQSEPGSIYAPTTIDQQLADVIDGLHRLLAKRPAGLEVNVQTLEQISKLLAGASRTPQEYANNNYNASRTALKRVLATSKTQRDFDELLTSFEFMARHLGRRDPQAVQEADQNLKAVLAHLEQVHQTLADKYSVHFEPEGGLHEDVEAADAAAASSAPPSGTVREGAVKHASDPPFAPSQADDCSNCSGEGCQECEGMSVKEKSPKKTKREAGLFDDEDEDAVVDVDSAVDTAAPEYGYDYDEDAGDDDDEDSNSSDESEEEEVEEPIGDPPETGLVMELEADPTPASAPVSGDPFADLMSMLPEVEPEAVDFDQRINDHLEHGTQLRDAVGDMAEKTVERVRKFVGQE